MITPNEFGLIEVLFTKPLTVPEAIELQRGAKNTLYRMLHKGFVSRRGAPYRYTLTPKGEAVWRLLK